MSAVERIGQALAKFGNLYWQPEVGYVTRDEFRVAERDWRRALELFLRYYAFEHAGRSPKYGPVAAEAVAAYGGDEPGDNFEGFLWERFRSRIGPGSLNAKVNPLAPQGEFGHGNYVSVARFTAELHSACHNLVAWAREELRAGHAVAAKWGLTRVRGVGPKIASLFLRDVADAFLIEVERESAIDLQPVDRWTKRAADALAPLLKRPVVNADYHCAQVLVELGERAGVRPTLVNAGIWLLAARGLSRGESLEDIITDPDLLERRLDQFPKSRDNQERS